MAAVISRTSLLIVREGGTLGTSFGSCNNAKNLICRVSASVHTYLLINPYNPRQKHNGLHIYFTSDLITLEAYHLELGAVLLITFIPPSTGSSSSLGEGTAFSSEARDSTTNGASRNFNNCLAWHEKNQTSRLISGIKWGKRTGLKSDVWNVKRYPWGWLLVHLGLHFRTGRRNEHAREIWRRARLSKFEKWWEFRSCIDKKGYELKMLLQFSW